MRFRSARERWNEYYVRNRKWRLVFAWRPVKIGGRYDDAYSRSTVWLEWVAKRLADQSPSPPWRWEYAPKTAILTGDADVPPPA
jgi:hypothetical protein